MKNISIKGLIIGLVFMSLNSFASDQTRQSLSKIVSANNINVMVSGGREISSIGGANVGNGDLRLGLVFNDQWTTGIYYQRSLNEFVPVNETIPGLYTEYQSVGGLLEYTLFPNRLLHITFPLKIGYGHLEMDTNSDWDEWIRDEQHLFVLQPGAFAVLNVTPLLNLYAGATYRITNGFEYRAISSASTQGVTGQLGLKFHIPTKTFRNNM